MKTSQRIGGLDEASLRAARLIEESSPRVAQYQRKMAAVLTEIARLDGLERFRASGELPTEAMKKFHKVLDLYDSSARFMLGMLRHGGLNVRCRTGCSHCCLHMPAGISSIEMLAVYLTMGRSGFLNRFFRRCLEAEEIWSEICLDHREGREEGCLGGTPKEITLKSYLQWEHPCPFLENSECLIYPWRPFACRMHFSLSPPHWCDPGHFQSPYAVRFNLEPEPEVLDALDRLDTRLGLELSDILACGLLELTVNVMRFAPVRCI